MAVDRRRANVAWFVTDSGEDVYPEMRDGVMLAVLMDIRDELQRANVRLDAIVQQTGKLEAKRS